MSKEGNLHGSLTFTPQIRTRALKYPHLAFSEVANHNEHWVVFGTVDRTRGNGIDHTAFVMSFEKKGEGIRSIHERVALAADRKTALLSAVKPHEQVVFQSVVPTI